MHMQFANFWPELDPNLNFNLNPNPLSVSNFYLNPSPGQIARHILQIVQTHKLRETLTL